MVNWNFNANDYEEKSFKPIPAGDHRVRIFDAIEKTSKSGNDMIEVTLEVSGYSSKVWYYLVLKKDDVKKTNQKLGEFWSSFAIPMGNFALNSWKGKVGGAKLVHEEYEGNTTVKVAYLLNGDRQEKLAPWREPSVNSSAAFVEVGVDEAELPFF